MKIKERKSIPIDRITTNLDIESWTVNPEEELDKLELSIKEDNFLG